MLDRLIKELEKKPAKAIFIPKVWNVLNLKSFAKDRLLVVNEKEYYLGVINSFLKEGDYSKSLSFDKPDNWLREAVAYSMMIRTSTTWDYNNDGIVSSTETGTFIKTILLIPYLKQMGVNLLYLLPVSKYSRKNKKGDLGSVYAVRNFFELDSGLKDDFSLTIEEEFICLVEACHMNGIRVVIDIIPRTNAVDSDLIQEHPDWFYWIKDGDYKVPKILEIDKSTVPNTKNMKYVYKSRDTLRHLSMFTVNPGTHPMWDELKGDLGKVKDVLNIRIAPAFSDHINDPQPPWSDITFFRMFLDHPLGADAYLDKEYPPYILFDSIKSNKFPGTVPNEELWKMLENIIPYYQQFGVDGARIDMGHALPIELTKRIISKAKSYDKSFIFVAEEMDPSNAGFSKDLGYDLILGNGFWMTPRTVDNYHYDFYKEASKLPIPSFASGETHDTQRLAARPGNSSHSKMITLLNMFAPNSVPFINSGQELFEVQPMNLGLDCKPDEDKNLPKSDPFYMKLALFDKYQFHYLNDSNLIQELSEVSKIRSEYLNHILNGEFTVSNDGLLVMKYKYDCSLIIAANFSDSDQFIEGRVLYSTIETDNLVRTGEFKILLTC